MTPDPIDHQPYTTPDDPTRCNVAGCSLPSATLDFYAGRRCRIHRPRYDPARAVLLAAGGWDDTLAAYRRQCRRPT